MCLFTFQPIAYLVDRAHGAAPAYCLRDYALFVSFVPQLIAGPIVRHDQIIGQYALAPRRDSMHERFGQRLIPRPRVRLAASAMSAAPALQPYTRRA
jgi:D-alanyl-lipoteichoic acid acyltransferase DltB (MBOAT superfamily)